MDQPGNRVSEGREGVEGATLTVQFPQLLVHIVPHLPRHRALVVQRHPHPRHLAALSGEDVRRGRLLDHRLANQYRIACRRIDRLDLQHHPAARHRRVRETHPQRIARQHHADELGAPRVEPAGVGIRRQLLDDGAHDGAGVHAVGDGAGQVRVCRKGGGDVDGVVVAGEAGVGGVGAGHGDFFRCVVGPARVLQRDGGAEGRGFAGEVVEDGVAAGGGGGVGDAADVGGGAAGGEGAGGAEDGEGGFVGKGDFGGEGEGESAVEEGGVGVVELEPGLGLEDGFVDGGGEAELEGGVGGAFEGGGEVGEAALEQEFGGNGDERDVAARDDGAHDDGLAWVLDGDGFNGGRGCDGIANLELGGGEVFELVGKVYQAQDITPDLGQQERCDERLPSEDDGQVQRHITGVGDVELKIRQRRVQTEGQVTDQLLTDDMLWASEGGADCLALEIGVGQPETAVEGFDVVGVGVSIGEKAAMLGRNVGEVQREVDVGPLVIGRGSPERGVKL